MKKLYRNFFIVFIIALSHPVFSQDTLQDTPANKKLIISFYLDVPIVYAEPGIQFQYFLKEDHYVELKYGYSFFDFNIYSGENQVGFLPTGDGPSLELAGCGHMVRFGYGYLNNTGFKQNWRDYDRKIKRNKHEFRVTYKDIFFPTYEYLDGSPGSFYTPIYHQSEKRQVIVLNYVNGKQLTHAKIYGIDFNMIFGLAYAIRNIRQYSMYAGYNTQEINVRMTKTLVRPSIGIEFVFHLKAYEKNFKP